MSAGDGQGASDRRVSCSDLETSPADRSNLAPLSILYDPSIAALGAFTLAVAIYRRISIDEALAAAGEMGEAFGVDVEFSQEGIKGIDADLVKGAGFSCHWLRLKLIIGYCDDYLEFGRQGLYDVSPFDSLPVSVSLQVLRDACPRQAPSESKPSHTRIFQVHVPTVAPAKENGDGKAEEKAKNGD